jgi:hypothetical protein
MHSQRQFTPGKKSGCAKIINYVAEYNNLFPNSNSITCPNISQDKYNKLVVGSDSPSIRISNSMRLAQIINFYKGGKTQYGNFYLGQPLNVNYLGRMEGMPGGSGTPPINRF